MKNISKKSITCSIILLFIGVSISSGISVDTETTQVEECGCNEVDTKHLQFLERQLNRIDRYSKLLLVLSRYNPELKEISGGLSNKIIIFKENLDGRPVCDMLESMVQQINVTVWDLFEIYWSLDENDPFFIIKSNIIGSIIIALFGISYAYAGIALVLLCEWVIDIL